jgi:hypothetical protein
LRGEWRPAQGEMPVENQGQKLSNIYMASAMFSASVYAVYAESADVAKP